MSVPSARSAEPSATATAEPELDPPGIRLASCGLAGKPTSSLMPLTPKASSWSATVPATTPPAARTAATTGASSASGGAPARVRDPAPRGSPRTAIRSFTATTTPASGVAGPGGRGGSPGHSATHGPPSATARGRSASLIAARIGITRDAPCRER